MDEYSDPNEVEKRIKNFTYQDGTRIFNVNDYEDFKVQLMVDEKVGPGMFRPSTLAPGIFFANSLTIAAVRKNLFTTDSDTEALEKLVQCQSCHQELDEQFWECCPYCGGRYEK